MFTRRRESSAFGKYQQPPPNFLQDIIMPTIYNIENIKIVSTYKSKASPKNKVHQARKKKIQQKILEIVNKQKQTSIRTPDKMQRPHTAITKLKKNSETPEKKCHLMVGQQYRQHQFQLEMENQINEQGFMNFQTHKRQKKRIQQMLSKVKRLGVSVHSKQVQQNINIYLTSISPTKLIKANQKIFVDHNKGEGHLIELKKMQKKGNRSAVNIKKIERNNSDTKGQSFPLRLASTASGTRRTFSQTNLKTIVRNEDLKAQSNLLLDTITAIQENNSFQQNHIKEKFRKMEYIINKIVDKKNNPQDDKVVLGVSIQTLQLLRMKRMKQISLKELDKKMLDTQRKSDNNVSN